MGFPDSSSNSAFTGALESFKQHDLTKSRDQFLALIKESPNDPTLLYNLGLVEYTDQHPGRALAYWRKALYIHPGFSPALAGMRKLEAAKLPSLDSISWGERLSFYIPLSWLLCLFTACLIVSAFLFVRWRRARKFHLEAPSLALPLSLLAVGTCSAFLAGLYFQKTELQDLATIMVPSSAVHSSPSDSSPALFDFREGDSVLIRRAHGPWYQVQKGATSIGWLQKQDVFVHSSRNF